MVDTSDVATLPPRVDIHSDTWRTVKALCEQNRATHQQIVNSPDTPFDETQVSRGAIAELDQILALGKTEPNRQLSGSMETAY